MTDEELIKKVAEEVMGWTKPKALMAGKYRQVFEDDDLKIGQVTGWMNEENGSFYPNTEWDTYHYWKDSDNNYIRIDGKLQYGKLEFNPLTNVNHMMQVVERMRKLGWRCTFDIPLSGLAYSVWFWKENNFGSKRGINLRIGHAVCEAALKAVRHE